MSTRETTYLGHPPRLGSEDEGLHAPPPEGEGRLFADTVWLSAIAPEAGIVGFTQHHISPNRGYGRYQCQLWIDGVRMVYVGKQVGGLEPGMTSWSDGRMRYDVVEPFERIRLTLDHTHFGFDFEYTARHVTFDYEDCVGGSPLAGLQPVAGVHGGHYEQALDLRGTFEIRSGPAAGEVREIEAVAHRDHTWSDRFAGETPWAYPAGQAALHYWLVLQFPERNINVTGFFDLSVLGVEREIDRIGGFESSARGARPVLACRPAPLDGGLAQPAGDQGPRRFRIEFEDGEVIHVRATRLHGIAKLLMLGEDDAESRLNDYEAFVDLEIEETGERGNGVMEHSTWPPDPRWLA